MKDPLKIAAEVDHEAALEHAKTIASSMHRSKLRMLALAYIAQHAELVLLREVAVAVPDLMEATDAEIEHESKCDLRPKGRDMSKVVPMPQCDCVVRDIHVARAHMRHALAAWRSQTGGENGKTQGHFRRPGARAGDRAEV